MFKFGLLTAAEELSSHWSDTLMLPAFIVAVHVEVLAQFAMCGIFLVIWTALKIRGSVDRAKEATANTAAKNQ